MLRKTFALLFALLCSWPLSAQDWPLFRGDARMSGVRAKMLPETLEEIWAFKCADSIETAPAIVGNVVYIASMDKFLYAVDLQTGKQIWKTQLGSMKAAPSYHEGRIYVGDVEGKFFAVDAKTGSKIWTFETNGEITASANFYKDRILIGSHDSTLYALTLEGKKAWEMKIDGPVNGTAAVVGDRTFVAGCDSLLHVIDIGTGKSLGTVDLGGQAAATAAVVDDMVYVGTMANQVVGVNWKTLKKGWEFEAKRRQQPFYSSAAVTNSLVVIGSRDKKIYALDRETGKEKWNFVTEGMVDASPVIVGNRVYVGTLSNTGEFYVLDLGNGRKVQEITLDSAVTGSAAVGEGFLLVGTEKGTLYKLGKK
jgi:outer membrane protein assembly factor BamB